jgi:transposase
VVQFAAGLPRCVMAMEACCGAHYLGRILQTQGHEVRLTSPEYVRPYVKAQKNDDRDAEAIAEAASRPTMRFVELTSQDQLDLQTLHRVRSRLVNARKTLINQMRAILLERGHVIAKGPRQFDRALNELLADANLEISGRMRTLIIEMREEWQDLDRRIETLNAEFKEHIREHESARRLVTIPGIGVLNATALTAAIGDGSAFGRGRDLAAWLGLVPRQVTTGGRPKLLGITKRGNKYLRMLFIHGARAALPSLASSATPLGQWLRGLLTRAHRNVVTVALAAKLARIAWASLRRGAIFEPVYGTVA